MQDSDVRRRALIRHAPELSIGACVDELDDQLDAPVALHHTSQKQCANAELPPEMQLAYDGQRVLARLD